MFNGKMLKIPKALLSDNGIYNCRATNHLGIAEMKYNLQVICKYLFHMKSHIQ